MENGTAIGSEAGSQESICSGLLLLIHALAIIHIYSANSPGLSGRRVPSARFFRLSSGALLWGITPTSFMSEWITRHLPQ